MPRLIPPRHAKIAGVVAVSHPHGRRGRLCVRVFLRMGSAEPLLQPKTTIEIRVRRVHGRTNTPRVSSAPTTSTQRRHGNIDRVGQDARSHEPTPPALAPATTVSTPLHGACVDRGNGLVELGLARELIVEVETWLALEYTASLIKIFDRLNRHANAFALAQSRVDSSKY